MKYTKVNIIAISIALCIGISHAGIPFKKPIETYSQLWQNSPFTAKPQGDLGVIANPLDDFTLTGVAPIPGGYRITIISKKNPELKKVIEPGIPGEFQVISVNRNPERVLGTTVVLSTGSVEGTVTFEPKLISLSAAPDQRQNVNPTQVVQIAPPATPIPAAANPNQIIQPRPRTIAPALAPEQNPTATPSQ